MQMVLGFIDLGLVLVGKYRVLHKQGCLLLSEIVVYLLGKRLREAHEELIKNGESLLYQEPLMIMIESTPHKGL